MKPSTPLPWFDDDAVGGKGRYVGNGKQCVVSAGEVNKRDAAYIVHACNAYPELVAALRDVRAVYSLQAARDVADPECVQGWRRLIAVIDKHLAKLGEA